MKANITEKILAFSIAAWMNVKVTSIVVALVKKSILIRRS